MAKKLYIIDGHAHIYSAYYAPMRPLTGPSGEPTKAVFIFTNILLGLINKHNPDMIAVAMDSKAPSFRKEIYPDYKAHRPPMPEDLPAQIDRITQIVKALNIPIFRLDGYEADDLIGTLAKDAAAKGTDVFICSKDKDMLQLIDEHISTYDIKKDKRTDPQSMLADMNITPAQFIDCLAMAGDTADNIPGVPDVGPKTALTWIQKYGSIENLYDHAEEIKGKRGENLRASKEIAMLSKELVTIDCQAPIKIDDEKLKLQKPDTQKLIELFSELGFNKLLTQLGLAPDEIPETAGPKGPASAKTIKKDYQLIDTEEKLEKFLTQLKKQKIFAVDTETTSLRPMAADLVGMSFSWKADTGFYLPVKVPLGQKHLPLKLLQQKIGPILADENVKKIGQNIKYDILVLHNAGFDIKGVEFDTMVASYCLSPEKRSNSMDAMAKDYLDYETIPISALIGKGKNQLTFDMVDTAAAVDYAAEDADITYQLYEYLKVRLNAQPELKKLFDEVEMPLVTVLAKMEIAGVSLDTNLLRSMSHTITKTIEELTENIHTQAGSVFNIDSPKQLSEVLFDRLGLTSVRSGKTTRSTDAAVLEQLKHQHEIIPFILQYRQLVKLKNTYTAKLGQLINPRTDRLHASFNQTTTATGRLSSSDPNLQNIPIRTELGKKIRSAFIAENKTDCILSADYSQIELRLLAHFSQDPALTNAFANDEDIHTFVASQIYCIDIEDVTKDMRDKCKAVNFGIIYGQGSFGLSQSIGITRTEAKKFIEDYFARYSSIRKFMDDSIEQAKATGYAQTILGRRRTIDGLDSKNFNKRSQGERLTTNTIIQGSAADLIKVAMINIQNKIDNENLPVKMILQIHDELVFELPKSESEKHAKWIIEEMTTAMKLSVPLKVDVAIGPTWLEEK